MDSKETNSMEKTNEFSTDAFESTVSGQKTQLHGTEKTFGSIRDSLPLKTSNFKKKPKLKRFGKLAEPKPKNKKSVSLKNLALDRLDKKARKSQTKLDKNFRGFKTDKKKVRKEKEDKLKNLKIGKLKITKRGKLKDVKSGNLKGKKLDKKFSKNMKIRSMKNLKEAEKKKVVVKELPVKITWLVGINDNQIQLIESENKAKGIFFIKYRFDFF